MLERVWVQLMYPRFSTVKLLIIQQLLSRGAFDSAHRCLSKQTNGWQATAQGLLVNRHLPQALRQQTALEGLLAERRHLTARLKLLGLIATIAPLLGLLGTVFGIIDMFQSIAHNTGPVTPALLAEGMWTAMVTTALGLMIAIPAMAVAHGFDLLTQARLAPIQGAANTIDRLLATEESAAVDNLIPESIKEPVNKKDLSPLLAAAHQEITSTTPLQSVAGAA